MNLATLSTLIAINILNNMYLVLRIIVKHLDFFISSPVFSNRMEPAIMSPPPGNNLICTRTPYTNNINIEDSKKISHEHHNNISIEDRTKISHESHRNSIHKQNKYWRQNKYKTWFSSTNMKLVDFAFHLVYSKYERHLSKSECTNIYLGVVMA